MSIRKYHPALVVLHWLLAIMIGMQLGFGYFGVGKMANSDPAKLEALAGHMGIGTAIIVLMFIRLTTRYFTTHPEPSASQLEGIGKLRTPVHHLLYIVIFVTAIAGWLTGYQIAHLYEQPGNILPADFPSMTTRVIHVWMALVLFLLVVLHVAAAIKEHATGDKSVFARMGFGKRLG